MLRRLGPDHLDQLAGVLHDEAVCRSELGEDATALDLVTEAVALRRRLLDGTPSRTAELVESLNNLADTLHDLNRIAEGLEVATEAVELSEQLLSIGGPQFRRYHVYCLLTRAQLLPTGPARSASLSRAEQVARDDADLQELVREATVHLGPG
jgi:hypothetical protein